mgnify:CR=1 FL=1
MVFAGCREEDLDMTVMHKTLYEGAAMKEITVEDAWSVTFLLDTVQSYVELEYSAFLEEYLLVKQEGDALFIGLNTQLYNLPGNTVMNAVVHTAAINKLSLSDAVSAAFGDGTFPETALVLEMSDATTLKGGHFQGAADIRLSDASTCAEFCFDGTTCHVELDDASVLKGSLHVSDILTMTIKDASRLTEYGGEINHADVEVTEGSYLNMATSIVNSMQVVVNSVSEATVNVVESLGGSVHDASKLYYSGNPTLNVDCDETSILQQVEYPNP